MVNIRRIAQLLCLMVQLFAYSQAYEIEYFANDEGWRPIVKRREQVHNGSPDYIPTTNQMRNADHLPKQADDIQNIDKLWREAMKLVKPYQIFSEFNIVNEGFKEIPRNVQAHIQADDDVNDEKNVKGSLSNHLENKTRKAKTISEINQVENGIRVLLHNGNKDTMNKDYDVKDMQVITKVASKRKSTYAVSENPEETVDHLKADQSNAKETGYFYKMPTKNRFGEEKSNISAKFFNLLSKYKINNEDNLRNYALSRNTNLRNYFNQENVYLPIPILAIDRRNSLSHLRVNPLLAVYLSNYGYYLPGSYGPRNQFRNLYGYLASNNIHNNRPFGPYKVFSDADSSNK